MGQRRGMRSHGVPSRPCVSRNRRHALRPDKCYLGVTGGHWWLCTSRASGSLAVRLSNGTPLGMDEVKTRLQLLATETGTDATKLAEDLSKGGTLASVAGLERQRLLVNLTPVAAV